MNIEPRCAHFGSQIVRNRRDARDPRRLETIVRNALGVMREEGLFAFYLYLRYRWEEGGRVIWPQIKALWQDEAVGPLWPNGEEDREGVIEITGDLHTLLLAREVTERALVYALYGLRAEG